MKVSIVTVELVAARFSAILRHELLPIEFVDAEDDAQLELWSRAWDLAKRSGFSL